MISLMKDIVAILTEEMNETEKEKNMAIKVLQVVTSKDVHPMSKLYAVFNGDLEKTISLIDNPEVLRELVGELNNLRKTIDNAINDMKGTAENRAVRLEIESKRFDKMSREDLIAHIKELEKERD